MNNKLHPHQKEELADLAVAAMRERGLQPEFSGPALQQLRAIDGPGTADGADIADLSGLLWCSIDNDDSRDLDQITLGELYEACHLRIPISEAHLPCRDDALGGHVSGVIDDLRIPLRDLLKRKVSSIYDELPNESLP